MKIAMIGHKRMPSREGGVEIVVEELSTRLVKGGHEVDVYNRRGKNVQDKSVDKEKGKLKEYKGVKIITIPTINKKGIDALLYSFFATVRALFGRYDVIHYHAEGPCAMLWIPHLFGIKTVATIHGLDWKRSKWGGFATRYIKFGEKIAAKYADEIIVLSDSVQKYFKETYNRDTTFIPNGVNKPETKKAKIIKEKWGLEKDSYILFLARIVPEKGLHYLIEAYKKIDTDKKLVIAGGASHTNDYLEKIKDMVKDDNRIIMTGFVQGQELEELYSNCYLYCLPSDIEGMPISLLEAMSYGCDCLVSNIEENTQVIGEYATSFEKGNIKDLEIKLKERFDIDKEDKREEISNYILDKYNWKETTSKTEKIYCNKNKSKKNKLISFFSLIISVIVIIFNFVLETKISKLINYSFVYLIITMIFLAKNNKNLELDLSLLIVGFYTLMLGACPIVAAIDNGVFYERQYVFILLSYLLMLLGYTINFKRVNNKNKSKQDVSTKKYDNVMKILAFMILACSVAASVFYLIKNQITLFGGDLENGRITAMSGNGIILQIMKLSIISGAILLEQYAKKNVKLITLIITSIVIVTINLTTGFRSGILTYMLIVLLVYNKSRKLNIKKIIFILIPLCMILLLLGGIRGGILSSGNKSIIQNALTTLQVGSMNLNAIINRFPEGIDYQYGYTYLINIIMLKPGPNLDFTLWLKNALGFTFNGGGVTPTIIGEFYLNFGYIGTYVGMFWLGIMMSMLQKKYAEDKNIGLYAFLVTMLTGVFRGGIANITINTLIGVIAYIGCSVFAKMCERIIKNEDKN